MSDVPATKPEEAAKAPQQQQPEGEQQQQQSAEDSKPEFFDDEGNAISKAAWKKLQKMKAADAKRAVKAEQHSAHIAAQQSAKRVAPTDEVVVVAKPTDLDQYQEISILDIDRFIDQKVRIRGWAANVRKQKAIIFVEMRDGYGVFVQVVIDGDNANTQDAKKITKESSLDVYGTVVSTQNKDGQQQIEVRVAYWDLIHAANSDYSNRFNAKKSSSDILLDQRHLVLREKKDTAVLELASEMAYQFRTFFRANRFTEVFPPTIVQNQVEGGSTLFELDYFAEKAYLTQSSQLYLEAAAPAVRRAYCLVPSYRAERSATRRHLSTFMHLEAEMSFINFDDLRNTIEQLVMHVVTTLLADERFGALVKELNPNFVPPSLPFIRMDYTDAIQWLHEHDIKKEDGTEFVFGDDIPESPERFMVDSIGKPVFLSRFPTDMKPFYMYRDEQDPRVTESCDLLMPGVGEIVGGSMRIWDEKQLLEGFEREKLDAESYSWYCDLRKYGSVPHGGFGLGFERFVCWLLGLYNIREACLFPRTADRCKP